MNRCALLVSLGLFWSVAASAQDRATEATAAALRDAALARNDGYGVLSELTTRFGPRPAGSAAERASARWLSAKLNALGFANVAVHDFPLLGWTRGLERGAIVAPGPQPLVIAALGGSPATPRDGITGEVVSFPSLAALEAAPRGSLAGKVALLQQGMAQGDSGFGYGFAVQGRTRGPVAAAERGAKAFLMRSLATGDHRFAHTGSSQLVDGRLPIPAFALATPDANQLARLAALGERTRVQFWSTAATGATMSSYVVAEVKGRERPDEIVLLAAHLDSWDQGTGALDDGAGVAIITAAAKLIRDQPIPPRRTVRIVFYGAEEVAQPGQRDVNGLAYADAVRPSIDRHVLAMESDEGADPIFALSLPPAWTNSAFAAAAQRVLGPLGIAPAHEPPGRGGGDIAALVTAGVPAFGLQQTATRYFNYHHTADDTLEKVDRAAFDQNVAAWASLIWLAADSSVDFRSTPSTPTLEHAR